MYIMINISVHFHLDAIHSLAVHGECTAVYIGSIGSTAVHMGLQKYMGLQQTQCTRVCGSVHESTAVNEGII